jgi:hypothetical protein
MAALDEQLSAVMSGLKLNEALEMQEEQSKRRAEQRREDGKRSDEWKDREGREERRVLAFLSLCSALLYPSLLYSILLCSAPLLLRSR